MKLMRSTEITQADALRFVRDRWPHRLHPEARALKVGEECGEIQGAVTKWLEGRDTVAHIAQEAAQAVIVIMSLAESVGFDLADAVDAEWALVQNRIFGNQEKSRE